MQIWAQSAVSAPIHHHQLQELALGTAPLTDTAYFWQLLIYYPVSLSAAHGAWIAIPDGMSATLCAVRCQSVWPLVHQFIPLMRLHFFRLRPTITSSNLPESASASLFGGSCTTDTILLCNRRVTSRPDSGRHSALFMENVPKVTHTLNSGSNIFIPRCLIHRIVLSAGRNITLLIAGLNGYPVCPPTSRDTHVLSSRRP